MEIFVVLMIGAIGGFWWLNHIMKKNAEKANEASAPYKVEPVAPVQPESAPAPVVEVKQPEPVAVVETKVEPVEAKPAKKSRAPRATKTAVKKSAATSKAVVRKPKKA